jgi:hypothetical protein
MANQRNIFPGVSIWQLYGQDFFSSALKNILKGVPNGVLYLRILSPGQTVII